MNKPVDGRITDMKERYKGGVLKYKQMGYWRPDYEPKETDFICVFRITPQEGVDEVEAAAAEQRSRSRRCGGSMGETEEGGCCSAA